eukprot:758295-Prymnesium_polylepis.1
MNESREELAREEGAVELPVPCGALRAHQRVDRHRVHQPRERLGHVRVRVAAGAHGCRHAVARPASITRDGRYARVRTRLLQVPRKAGPDEALVRRGVENVCHVRPEQDAEVEVGDGDLHQRVVGAPSSITHHGEPCRIDDDVGVALRDLMDGCVFQVGSCVDVGHHRASQIPLQVLKLLVKGFELLVYREHCQNSHCTTRQRPICLRA